VVLKTYSLTHTLNCDSGLLVPLKTVCVTGERFKLDVEIFTLDVAHHEPRTYDEEILLPDNQIPVHRNWNKE
jgi:hypothetical protein